MTYTTSDITRRLAGAKTVADFAGIWVELEESTDKTAIEIKDEHRRIEERIRSARYKPAEERRQLTEARTEVAARLDSLRTGYETNLEQILDAAVSRAFPAGSMIGTDAVNVRHATETARRVDTPAEAVEILGSAFRSRDDELVAAIARESYRRGWRPVIDQIAREGSTSQRQGTENLSWVDEVRHHAATPKGRFFGDARFSTFGTGGDTVVR